MGLGLPWFITNSAGHAIEIRGYHDLELMSLMQVRGRSRVRIRVRARARVRMRVRTGGYRARPAIGIWIMLRASYPYP